MAAETQSEAHAAQGAADRHHRVPLGGGRGSTGACDGGAIRHSPDDGTTHTRRTAWGADGGAQPAGRGRLHAPAGEPRSTRGTAVLVRRTMLPAARLPTGRRTCAHVALAYPLATNELYSCTAHSPLGHSLAWLQSFNRMDHGGGSPHYAARLADSPSVAGRSLVSNRHR